MRRLFACLALIALPAAAQVPPAEVGTRNVPAPWWMRDPVIASLGKVEVDLPANRAEFQATFSVVERTVDEGTTAAARRVAAIDRSLRAFGAERVQVRTTFETRPLYDQYRDKDGTLVDNRRADKIDRYEVSAAMRIAVSDMSVLEPVYNAIVDARPSSIGGIGWRLDPPSAALTRLAIEAAKDAADRARTSASAVGARLGAVKVIDPTGGVCRTQVLAGWPSYASDRATALDSNRFQREIVMTAARMDAPPPPPPAKRGPDASAVTLTPPLERLSDEACVVYSLL